MFWIVSADGKQPATLTAQRRQAFRSDAITIEMYYVPSGEAVVVSRGPHAILIDGGSGSENDRNDKLGGALARRLPRHSLKAIVASHPHRDHTNFHHTLTTDYQDRLSPQGVLYVDNATPQADANWQRLQDWQASPLLRRVAVTERRREISGFSGATDAYLVRGSTKAKSVDAQKYWSVFLFLRYRNAWMLFTGDAYKGYEKGILARLRELNHQAHLLKVTHHGSSDGTSPELLVGLRPKIAIASTDADPGHRLERDVRDRLQLAGSEAYATFEPGPPPHKRDIIVHTDGRIRKQDGFEGVLFEVRTRKPALR